MSNSNQIVVPSHFEPRWYQLPVMQAIDNGILNIFLLWHRRCIAKGQRVHMADGTYKPIEDVEVGDMVLSWDDGKIVNRKVIDTFYNGIAKVNNYSGLICTPDHKILCKGEWKEIQHASHLTRPRSMGHGTINNPSLAEFIGLMLTDGYIQLNQTPKFTNINTELLDRFEELAIANIENVQPKRYRKGNGYDIVLTGKTKYGRHPIRNIFTDSNSIPDIVYSFDKESLLAFFSGVIAGDGSISVRKCKTPRGHMTYSSNLYIEAGISEQLAYDYQFLLYKLGIRSSVKKDKRGRNYRVRAMCGREIKQLYTSVDYKQEKLDLISTLPDSSENLHIKKRELYIARQTYDLTIEGKHNYIVEGNVVHNTGKDLTCWSITCKKAMERVGTYFYCLPSYAQGRKIIWEGADNEGVRFLKRLPEECLKSPPNNTEMKLELINGSIIRVVGADADKIDQLVGTNPVGVVLSEFGVEDTYGQVLDLFRPILKLNGGWLIVEGTPRGRNHMYRLYNRIKNNPRWFVSALQTISPDYPTGQYTGLLSLEELEQEREDGMSEEMIDQEYGVSFNAASKGRVYQESVERADSEGRIGSFPHNHTKWTDVLCDLGIDDDTAMLFRQLDGSRQLYTDAYKNNNKDLAHYVEIMKEKGYKYRYVYIPHDGKKRNFTGTGRLRTVKEMLQECLDDAGIKATVIGLPKPHKKMNMIQGVRAQFSNFYFNVGSADVEKAVEDIASYSFHYDKKRGTTTDIPVHDETSHMCDALGCVAQIEKYEEDADMTMEPVKVVSDFDPVDFSN